MVQAELLCSETSKGTELLSIGAMSKGQACAAKNTYKREKERRKGRREGRRKEGRKEGKKLMMENKDLRVFSMCNLCERQEEGQIRGFGDPKSVCELLA